VTLENILLRVRARFVPLIPFGANLSLSVLEPVDIGWGLASTNFLEDFKAQLDGLVQMLFYNLIILVHLILFAKGPFKYYYFATLPTSPPQRDSFLFSIPVFRLKLLHNII
jgi:hypothetical protein